MIHEWQELTRLTKAQEFVVEKVRLIGSEVRIEGAFELPPLARLTAEDQIFVAAFVRSHGSIKAMEPLFGVSYPTVKNRLRRISEQLEFVQLDAIPSRMEILEKLDRGELSVEEALESLKEGGAS